MADTIEADFISKFHSLSGITIKERTKNLYMLLNKTQHSLQLTSGKINLSSLTPTSPLEESFKVTALIHFKCAHELLDVLKSENTFLIEKVFKHSSWIIKQAVVDLTPETLATQLFPNISYNTKLKLLHQLSLHLSDTQTAEKYYEAIKERYGYYLASKLLPCCSSDLIIKCIELYKTEITPRQLLIILKRYPNLTEIIFEKLDQQNAKLPTGEKYKSVLKYLSKNDFSLFLKLNEKYSPDIHLGSKETDSLIKIARDLNALKDVAKLCSVLKTKQIGKSMGSDFEQFYFTNFPKCIGKLRDNLQDACNLLKHLNDGEKLKLFMMTFKKIYGNEVWEHLDFIPETLIKWMSPDERASWMELHSRPSHISEDDWISFYKCDKSIPLLKEKILLSSKVHMRAKYIVAMLNTCKLNRDKSALLDVLKYVNSKHRNDRNTVTQEFLSRFGNLYSVNQLSEEYWNEIYQCIQFFILNGGYHYYTHDLLQTYIQHRVSCKLPINDILQFWCKQNYNNYSVCVGKPKIEKQCLIEFETLVPLEYKKEDINQGYLKYLYCIYNYNEKNRQDKLTIEIKKEYIDCVKYYLDKNSNNYEAQIAASVLILQDCTRTEQEGVLELFFKQEFYYLQNKIMNWLINENPTLLLKYLKYILRANSYHNFIPKFVRKFCVKYTHIEIPQTLCQLCYDVINDKDEEDTTKLKAAIVILSTVTTPQEFVTFSTPYYPVELSPDLQSDIVQTFYIKQQTIAGHFRNLIPISQALDGILQFCKGDYLKFAQKSIDAASNNVVENRLGSFITTLKGRAISVRKHAIFLSSRVLDKCNADRLLLEFKQKEKNPSLHKAAFKTVFRRFLNDPSEYSWDLTKEFMTLINVSDGEAFEILTTCQQVPLEYFGKYFEYSWNIIQKCTTSKKTVEDAQLSLLNLVTLTNISSLSAELCTAVIEQNLFKCEQLTDLQKNFHTFTSRFLIYGRGTDEQRLQTIFSQIRNIKTKYWSDIKSMPLMFKLMYNFVKQLCDDIIDKKCTNRPIIVKFSNIWDSIFRPSESFCEFVYLQLTLLYTNALNKHLSISKIGEEVAAICNLLHKENCLVVKSFFDCLSTFLQYFYALEFIGESDENEIVLIESIIDNRSNDVCLQLALYLLPSVVPIAPIVREKYDRIVDLVSKESNPKVQIRFRSYLRNVTLPNV